MQTRKYCRSWCQARPILVISRARRGRQPPPHLCSKRSAALATSESLELQDLQEAMLRTDHPAKMALQEILVSQLLRLP